MALRGSTGIALLFLDHGIRRGWGVSVTTLPLFTPGKDPVPTVQEAGWAPGLVWTSVEYLTPATIRSPDCPARIQSLYWLHYLAHHHMMRCHNSHMPFNSLSCRKPSNNFTYCKGTMLFCYAITTCLMLNCFFRLRPYLTDNYVVFTYL